MRKTAIVMALSVASVLSVGTTAAWANSCPILYGRCQEMIKQSKADAAVKQQITQMCEEGMKLHNSGKHKESVETLNKALGLLEKK
jgi:hypothetical protein